MKEFILHHEMSEATQLIMSSLGGKRVAKYTWKFPNRKLFNSGLVACKKLQFAITENRIKYQTQQWGCRDIKADFLLYHESSFPLWEEMLALGGKRAAPFAWYFPSKKARNSALVLCRKLDWELTQHEASYQTQKSVYAALGREYTD